MRHAALATGCVSIALWTGVATAQPELQAPLDPAVQAQVDALVSEGDSLAAAKDYAAAIERYKRADHLAPRALHACLIGAVYSRRALWPQAELFYAECHSRAAASDPAPKWLAAAEQELAAKMTAAGVAEVAFTVEPGGAGARLKLSGFAPDESFAPRTLHLPPGQHTVTVTAAGHLSETRTFDVEPGGAPLAIATTLKPVAIEPPPPPPPPAPPRVERSKLPWIVMGAGGALALGGGLYHATVLRGRWQDLEDTTDRAFYDGAGDEAWRSARRNTIILYSAAAVVLGTGVALRAMGVGDRREAAFAVGVEPRDGGGVVTVGWGH